MTPQHQQALQAAGIDHARLQAMPWQQIFQVIAALLPVLEQAIQSGGGGTMPPAQAAAGQRQTTTHPNPPKQP